jgi:DNA repair photolyase
MIKLREVKATSIINRSGIPGVDFVINPYVGCAHGCKYCYARFMKKYSGHKEEWGQFVDIKINSADIIKKDLKKYKNGLISISSVTDPYQPVEKKYKLTRKILEELLTIQPTIDIITKSDLILRDIDLISQFKDSRVIISLSQIDDNIRKELEPLAPPVNKRINTIKHLHNANIKTGLFISPILPELSNWRELILLTKDFVNEYWFENLNLYPSIRLNIYHFLRRNKQDLIKSYNDVYYRGNMYWIEEEKKIRKFCEELDLDYKIYFHYK